MRTSSTCLCIIQDPKTKKYIMASDKRVSSGGLYLTVPSPKVVKLGKWLFGCTGSLTIFDIFLKFIQKGGEYEFYDYITQSVLSKFKTHLVEIGFTTDGSLLNVPPSMETTILMVENHTVSEINIYSAESNCTGEVSGLILKEDLDIGLAYAIGCGGDFAKGSLLSTINLQAGELTTALYEFGIQNWEDVPLNVTNTEDLRLLLAIKVAAACSKGCDDQIDIVRED